MKQNKSLKVAVIQIPSLPIEKAKLDYYLMNARAKKVDIAILPEYTTNMFFKEFEHMHMGLIEEQSNIHLENLKKLSTVYGITIVAPMVVFKKKEPYKSISIFSAGSVKHYYQTVLMPYKHWNERAFFHNNNHEFTPFIFTKNGLKVAVIGGFEVHFDGIWQKLISKRVDVVLVPTASTFESASRWREIFRARAFTNSMYVVRANRIGEYEEPKTSAKWLFYGDSFVVDPFGEIEDALSDKEELLICELSKAEALKARRLWQFGQLGCAL